MVRSLDSRRMPLTIPKPLRPWIVPLAVTVVSMIALRLEGRIWWCDCGSPRLWISDVWTSHCSQHIADPYSITHLSHGLIFWMLLSRFAPKWSFSTHLAIVALAAGVWEVVENSEWIINRYRTETMSLDYMGDSVANAVADIGCAVLGYLLARRIGLWWTLGLFVSTELLLLWLIRDNLTLNVIMLIHPIDAIKAWQTAGH